MTHRTLLAAFLVTVPLAAGAAEVKVDRIDVIDAGIYTVETGAATADPGAPGDTIVAPLKATLVEATTAIPGGLGLEFGFRYVVVGAPAGAEVPLDVVITYPPPGLADPADPAPLRESRFTRAKKIGETVYLGYAFENRWEIIPGEWTMEIWFDGRKLAGRSFAVR